MIKLPIFIGSDEISKLLRINPREIKHYVKEYNLPAFQERAGGRWKARPESLEKWAKDYEEKAVKK